MGTSVAAEIDRSLQFVSSLTKGRDISQALQLIVVFGPGRAHVSMQDRVGEWWPANSQPLKLLSIHVEAPESH